MIDSDCIFCKIAAGEIPSSTIYEDDSFRAIFDIAPATKGHTIVLPKHHVKDIFSLTDEDASKIFIVVKNISNILKDVLHCDGFNILQNNGEAAGQTVFHLHIHLIPRYKDDTVKIAWEHGVMPDDLEKIIQEIKEAVNHIEAL